MTTNEIDIKVEIAEGVQMSNSSVAVVEIHEKDKEDYIRAKETLVKDIEVAEVENKKYKDLYNIIQDLDEYIDANFNQFKTIMKQVICQIGREPTQAQIYFFLVFMIRLIWASDYEGAVVVENIYGENVKKWLVTPHAYSSVTIERALIQLFSYIDKRGKKAISNGECFIAQLMTTGRIDCNECRNGIINIHFSEIKIVEDFMEGVKPVVIANNQLQNDYMQIKEKNLTIKCGNCTTNIQEIFSEKTKSILGE